jgi:hypothetical protein
MAWTWDITPAPAVGDKITAAGFGAQVDGAVAELQSAVDTITGGSAVAGATTYASTTASTFSGLLLREAARPGGEIASITRAGPVSCPVGTTTVVSSPASGRRAVKWLFVNAPTAGTSVKLTYAGQDMTTLSFSTGGVWEWDVLWPLTSTETITATVTGATATVTAGYGDRATTDVTRLGLASSSASGTLISSGTARTITHLWIGNPSTSTSATATVAVGGTNLLTTLTIPSGGLYDLSVPLPITNSQAVTYAGDGVTALTYMAAGR